MLLHKFVRDKSELLCNVVELLMANTTYAQVKQDVKETTVSTLDLTPYPQVCDGVDVDEAK